jgi:small subunit ribosomal protein S18
MSDETMTKAQGEEPSSAAPAGEPKSKRARKAEPEDAPSIDDADAAMLEEKDEPREPRVRRRGRTKVSYLTINKIDVVDYKDVAMLRRFLTERGKILPRRQTGNTAKQQRMISRSIKRAREMALLPFVAGGPGDDSLGRRPRRDELEEGTARRSRRDE